MKGGRRPSPRFRSEEYFVYEISKGMFYPNLQRFVWRRHAGAHPDGHQHDGRKPAETSFTKFCYKSVNLFFEELISIKVILFLIHELFTQRNFLKQVIFLNLHNSSLGRHVSAASCKSLEIQAYSITKTKGKTCVKISFQLL